MAKQLMIQVYGVPEVREMLKKASPEILKEADLAIGRAAVFIKSEIIASIGGKRAENRSRVTGNFMRMTNKRKLGIMQYEVYNDCEYGKYLEYFGPSSHWKGRRHFGNTVDRNKLKVQEFCQEAVNKAIAKVQQ